MAGSYKKRFTHMRYGFGVRGGCTNHTGSRVVIAQVRSRCLAALQRLRTPFRSVVLALTVDAPKFVVRTNPRKPATTREHVTVQFGGSHQCRRRTVEDAVLVSGDRRVPNRRSWRRRRTVVHAEVAEASGIEFFPRFQGCVWLLRRPCRRGPDGTAF